MPSGYSIPNMLFIYLYLLLFPLASARYGSHQHHHRHGGRHLHHASNNDTDPARSLAAVRINDILVPRELVIRDASSGQESSMASSGDYTCGPNKPCGNGACCGESGWCGYSPTYCGTGCQSNCNAKAECGEFAETPGKGCPLNVCCSQHGFCGTTEEFCGTGCQSHCEQPRPSPPRGNVQQKVIGYWEAWNENKPCEHMTADEIPVHDLSHLIYSFAFISPGDFEIVTMPDVRTGTFREVSFLKNKNPDLKIQVALGGWTHNDPGRWQKVFSDLASTQSNRARFIDNLLGFIAQYGYDGVDFDWEYPGADDRGGIPEDGVNYTLLLKELQAAMRSRGQQYLVTYTAPTSYWYLRHFDLAGMHQYVDWINLMSYDLHGTWDAVRIQHNDNPIGNQVLAHTNLTEIDLALDLFWRNDIPPQDLVLGIGFYGRSFRLEDNSCWKPGCRFVSVDGGGEPGPCTGTSGFLSYSEIMNLVNSRNAKPTYDESAAVKYLTYGQSSWISYDDAETFQRKIDFANERGLSGLMIWAIDLDDAKRSGLSALIGREVDNDPLALPSVSRPTIGHSTDDASQCRVTDCGGFCTQAETGVGRVKSFFGGNACGGGSSNARWVCCPAWTSLDEGDCYWNAGGGAVRTDCSGKCNPGDIHLFADSWGWNGDLTTGNYGFRCLRGGKSFCCSAGNKQRFLDICTWTGCGEACPSDKQNVLTTDSGGPRGNPRCNAESSGSPFDQFGPGEGKDNPRQGTANARKLCCPRRDSFKNCGWKSGRHCSEQCANGQITLGLDPRGNGGSTCHNGREQSFCCDAPGRKEQPFLPVDLDKIFPPEYLPPADALPQFELMSFHGRSEIGDADPNSSGVAFFLIAGSETAVSSMTKRGDSGVTFLSCPTNILDSLVTKPHTARVICMNADVEDCFKVEKNGVEGTVVHMPRDCGNGTYSRAISLQPSLDQSIPIELALQNPTSAVYDFTFDYNMPLVRRDAGRFSIRMDYSNVRGYWNAIVDSPGVRKRDLKTLVSRFFSSNRADWAREFNKLDIDSSASLSDLSRSSLRHLVFFDREMCSSSDGQSGQGIAAAIEGELDTDFYYGFSLIATWDPSSVVEVHQAAGFLHAEGQTKASYTVSGMGTLDTSQKFNGESIRSSTGKRNVGGHGLFHGWASFLPYKEETVSLRSQGEGGSAVAFNGYLEAQVEADWGHNVNVHFPSTPSGINARDLKVARRSNMTPLGNGNINAVITLASSIKLGLKVEMSFQRPYQFAVEGDLPDLSITQNIAADFGIRGADNSVCLNTRVFQSFDATMMDGQYVGWGSSYERRYAEQSRRAGSEQCFSGSSALTTREFGPSLLLLKSGEKGAGGVHVARPRSKKKRQNNSVPGDFSRFPDLPDLGELLDRETMNGLRPEINCNGCGSCTLSLENQDCCSCAWLAPFTDNLGSVPLPTSPFKRSGLEDDTEHLNQLFERASAIGRSSPKRVTFWDFPLDDPFVILSEPYPPYPDFWRSPFNDADWDGTARVRSVKKYFHNATNDCTSFDVTQAPAADVMYPWPNKGFRGFNYVRGRSYHQLYQTEHVFEGQTIARFFSNWINGKPRNDPRYKSRFWIEDWVFNPRTGPWGQSPFIHAVIDELGSDDHLDRLAIFLSRPNGMKGSLFKGQVALTPATFGEYTQGANQLLAARQLGMIFTYMNTNTIWQSFCDSYNGMLTLFTDFDNWYNSNPVQADTSHLAAEFPLFIRSELDRVAIQARNDLKMMDQRRAFAGPLYEQRWRRIMGINNGEIQKVMLARTDICRNLPASTVGPFTG